MPNTVWRMLGGNSIFGIFKLSFPFPFSLVRHCMELTINHFIQNISNAIERTHWILTSVSPMTTTFLEIEKTKINHPEYSEENFKIFQKFKTAVRLSWLSFLSRRFSSLSDEPLLLPRTKSNPVSSPVVPNPITRSNPETSFTIALSNSFVGASSSRMIPSTNLEGFTDFFRKKINRKTLSKSYFRKLGTHLGIRTKLQFLIFNKIAIIVWCCSCCVDQISPVYKTSHFNFCSYNSKI